MEAIERNVSARRDVDLAAVAVRAFEPVESEVDVRLDVVEGAVPEALRGVLYRNGPGSLRVGDTPQMHPFDGDGMVSRFAFEASGVRYRNRFVRTREWLNEQRAGRMLYRAFGTNLPGGFAKNALRMRFKNAANTSVVRHGGLLLALWEGGLPHALDPVSLATLGRFDYGGALRARSPLERVLVGELPFSAHPSICARTGELWNFGVSVAPRPTLLVHRVDAEGVLRETRRVPLPRASFVHDFVLTSRWAVFFLTPVRFDVVRALSGRASPVDAIGRDPSAPLTVLLVPRDGGEPRMLRAPACFVFHFFGAREDERGRVIVDGCRMDGFAGGSIDLRDAEALRRAHFDDALPTRWTIDPDRGRVDEEHLADVPMELPTVHPTRAARFGWAIARMVRGGAPVHTGWAKLDRETGATVLRDETPDITSEPVVVAKPGATDEDDAWLLALVYRAARHRTELVVLEARDLSTVARLALPHHQPPGFHGCFVDDLR
jgi:all-trans-8'-apo-beta-carotenal 15,15'-oxygenase